MVDITKEEFWQDEYTQIYTKSSNKKFWTEMIRRHKFLAASLFGFCIFVVIDIMLICNFFKLLKTI